MDLLDYRFGMHGRSAANTEVRRQANEWPMAVDVVRSVGWFGRTKRQKAAGDHSGRRALGYKANRKLPSCIHPSQYQARA